MSALIEELKRRGEKLLETTKQHFANPIHVPVKPAAEMNYRELKNTLLPQLRERADVLQNRTDALYEAIDKLEREQQEVDKALEGIKETIEAVEDLVETD